MSEAAKNEIAKQTEVDGFVGFDDRSVGDNRLQGGSIIQGTHLKFDNNGEWIPSGLNELAAIDLIRIAQKWLDQQPVQTIFVPPGERFPDVDAMNEQAPRSEWREDLNGKLVGPWQRQSVLYLVDLQTLDKYTYPTSTIGGGIAVRELADKVKWMRKHRGPNVNAVVTLSSQHMATRFGGRQRPHFKIVDWIGLADDKALAANDKLLAIGGVAMCKIKEPTLREELNDDLPPLAK